MSNLPNNPMQFLQFIRQGQNPQQLIMILLEQKMPNSPMRNNILNLARNQDGPGLEKLARNLCQQKGVDFDKEFTAFKQRLGL